MSGKLLWLRLFPLQSPSGNDGRTGWLRVINVTDSWPWLSSLRGIERQQFSFYSRYLAFRPSSFTLLWHRGALHCYRFVYPLETKNKPIRDCSGGRSQSSGKLHAWILEIHGYIRQLNAAWRWREIFWFVIRWYPATGRNAGSVYAGVPG